MRSAYSIHVGAAHVDPDVYADASPALGCDVAARAMETIAGENGYPNRTCLLNDEATLANVERQLSAAIESLRHGGDLLLTLAGHVRRRTCRVCGAPTSHHFSLHDGEWSCAQLCEALRSVRDDVQVVIVIEACFAAALLPTPYPVADMVALAACSEDVKASGATHAARHPPFTAALISACDRSDSYVSLQSAMAITLEAANHPAPVLRVSTLGRRRVHEPPFRLSANGLPSGAVR